MNDIEKESGIIFHDRYSPVMGKEGNKTDTKAYKL